MLHGQRAGGPVCQCRRKGRPTSLRTQAIFTTQTTVTTKDATAELLQAAFKFALQQRLKTHRAIDVEVKSNAFDLMGGKFGGLTVNGRGWCTPLQLTAESIQVAVNELLIDQGALLFERRVALKNVPYGSCTLVLTPRDLGNFMNHVILKTAAAKVVRGYPFVFDPNSVEYKVTGPGQGQVLYQGRVGPQGPVMAIVMDSPVHAGPAHASSPRTAYGNGVAAGTGAGPTRGVQQRIPVRAQLQQQQQQGQGSSPTGGHQQGNSGAPAFAADEEVVAQALSDLFSCLTLNLQGVELSRPRLRLLPAPATSTGTGYRRAASTTGTQGRAGGQTTPLVLEITLQLRLLDLPPLNMRF